MFSKNTLKHNLPNWLTIARIVVIIPIMLLMEIGSDSFFNAVIIALLFFFAIITDFLDGYLARRWNAGSALGRLLDPIADKLLVAALLIMFCAQGIAHPLAVSIIIIREIWVSGLREYMQEQHVIIHVSMLAKYKTTLQMLSCMAFIMAAMMPQIMLLSYGATSLLWIATLLTLITGMEYSIFAYRHIKEAS